ncbi:hypothetical protein HYDPIDRAFT_113294, partial [Hydnomerulius pinastri MD-312]
GHYVIMSISQSVRNSDQSDFIQPAIRKVMEDFKLDWTLAWYNHNRIYLCD